MKLIHFTLAAATILLASGASAAQPQTGQASRPPNIIFFLVDDLGQRDIGCYGSEFHETPSIDQLAK
ncbi:MAG: sulfatase, partial [Verrucomicrobiia bacterium]